MLENQSKKCTKCGETKTFDEFHNDKTRKDGKSYRCRECAKAYQADNREAFAVRKKRYYQENFDKTAGYRKQYYKENTGRIRQYYKDNAEKIKQSNKQYYKENVEYYKQYRQDNTEKIKQYRQTPKGRAISINSSHKRRAIKREGDVTTQEMLDLQQTATHCYWCKKKLKKMDTHIDHYLPLSKGGLHTLSNLVVTCQKCNLSKHAKDPQEFAASMGRLL